MIRLMIILFCLTSLFGAGIEDIPILKWADPSGSRPGTYEEWMEDHPYSQFHYILNRVYQGDGRLGNVAVLTEQTIAQYLETEIEQLAQSLTAEGYTVFDYQTSGGTPETLRTFLQEIYSTDGIEGVLMIGNMPVAWFEVYDYGGSLAQFPMDLFYMDLDGTWLDTISTGNGKYDGHVGNTNLEIYVGRLLPTGIGLDTLVLRKYFAKDKRYREGSMNLQKRALVFVDDDWVPWAPTWANDVSLLFPDTTNYWHPETTRASLYRTRLDSLQAWVSVFAHSSPSIHQFSYNSGSQYDYYYAYEYINQNPPTNFYNFFACSFCRYTQAGYGGGQAIFNEDYGIGAIGSTKSGSMLDFQFFYRPLGEYKTMGEAFRYWFDCIYDSIGITLERVCWHYGMTLLGDPFLKPTGHSTQIAENVINTLPGTELSVSNPVSDQINLSLLLDDAQHINLVLYDCLGRKINTIYSGRFNAGNNSMLLSMRDMNGMSLPTGIYLLRAEIGTDAITRKIVKIE
ncbi:MAG: T9SS type A sorting domain-containing protein [candidate division WOR-3 bacterium]|nr:T9SS type A sorting domain-containing protein [candidate division WOR-3 bacterium]